MRDAAWEDMAKNREVLISQNRVVFKWRLPDVPSTDFEIIAQYIRTGSFKTVLGKSKANLKRHFGAWVQCEDFEMEVLQNRLMDEIIAWHESFHAVPTWEQARYTLNLGGGHKIWVLFVHYFSAKSMHKPDDNSCDGWSDLKYLRSAIEAASAMDDNLHGTALYSRPRKCLPTMKRRCNYHSHGMTPVCEADNNPQAISWVRAWFGRG
jgi:hypothetical protein